MSEIFSDSPLTQPQCNSEKASVPLGYNLSFQDAAIFILFLLHHNNIEFFLSDTLLRCSPSIYANTISGLD
jgi:hypothetical protein